MTADSVHLLEEPRALQFVDREDVEDSQNRAICRVRARRDKLEKLLSLGTLSVQVSARVV